jgi:hypothetical protein
MTKLAPIVALAAACIGFDPSAQALASLQKAEIEKWWPILKAANIKGQ